MQFNQENSLLPYRTMLSAGGCTVSFDISDYSDYLSSA